MIKGTPVVAETLHINHPDASYGIFCFNDQGDLFLNSDYGAYCYAWRSYGPGPFREFLAGLNVEYLIKKFEMNYSSTTGKRSIPKFSKEKLLILCAEFIRVLKSSPAAQSISELQDKIKTLEEWKRQELDLWSPVLAFAQNNELPGLQVGASISKYILELLKREHFAASLKA